MDSKTAEIEVVRFGMKVLDPSASEGEDAAQLEAQVFESFFGNTEQQLEAEYAPWAARSHLVEMRQPSGSINAMIRVAWADDRSQPLKTIDDAGRQFGADVEGFLDEVGGRQKRSSYVVFCVRKRDHILDGK